METANRLMLTSSGATTGVMLKSPARPHWPSTSVNTEDPRGWTTTTAMAFSLRTMFALTTMTQTESAFPPTPLTSVAGPLRFVAAEHQLTWT